MLGKFWGPSPSLVSPRYKHPFQLVSQVSVLSPLSCGCEIFPIETSVCFLRRIGRHESFQRALNVVFEELWIFSCVFILSETQIHLLQLHKWSNRSMPAEVATVLKLYTGGAGFETRPVKLAIHMEVLLGLSHAFHANRGTVSRARCEMLLSQSLF